MALAGAHAATVAVVLVLHRDQPTVAPFAVIVDLSAALVPAVAAAEFVRYFVRAAQDRADAAAEQASAQYQVLAAAAIADDADRRLARLRTEVLPLLEDVASGRRGVDDADGAATAARLSAELRRELVEARSGAWLLAAPTAALEAPSAPLGTGASSAPGTGVPDGRDGVARGHDGWPGIVLLDPERLVGRLGNGDRAALGAVLAALRAVGGWAEVSVALSRDYVGARPDDAVEGSAFVTVVARADRGHGDVDPRVRAATDRAGWTVSLEPAGSWVVEGRLPVRGSARLDA
jgi:hypothetical protein